MVLKHYENLNNSVSEIKNLPSKDSDLNNLFQFIDISYLSNVDVTCLYQVPYNLHEDTKSYSYVRYT